MAGRIKSKLAKLLTQSLQAKGLQVAEVDPDDLTEAVGYHRTNTSSQNEALRWECLVSRTDLPKLSYWITSFATMTEIVRSGGITLSGEHYQFWADVA